jgi:hypothetical protein
LFSTHIFSFFLQHKAMRITRAKGRTIEAMLTAMSKNLEWSERIPSENDKTLSIVASLWWTSLWQQQCYRQRRGRGNTDWCHYEQHHTSPLKLWIGCVQNAT